MVSHTPTPSPSKSWQTRGQSGKKTNIHEATCLVLDGSWGASAVRPHPQGPPDLQVTPGYLADSPLLFGGHLVPHPQYPATWTISSAGCPPALPPAPGGPHSHFFSGKPLPVAGPPPGPPPGGWGCWCWRRAGSVLEGKAQVLLKSTSLGRPGSRLAGLAKPGSRRPLHRLSSDNVRCRLFCGDCCRDRVGHGPQPQPGSRSLSSEAIFPSWTAVLLTHPASVSAPSCSKHPRLPLGIAPPQGSGPPEANASLLLQ